MAIAGLNPHIGSFANNQIETKRLINLVCYFLMVTFYGMVLYCYTRKNDDAQTMNFTINWIQVNQYNLMASIKRINPFN